MTTATHANEAPPRAGNSEITLLSLQSRQSMDPGQRPVIS
jgi:hypothetical protein